MNLRKTSFQAAALALALPLVTSAAPVYLKAGATGTGDGSSWADAMTDVADAVSAAAAGDGVLYVAKGVYTFADSLTVDSDLAIYGGFSGDDMAETPESRDTAANATVFTGDTGHDDYWVHYAPDSGYSITTQNLTDRLILGPDGVNLPPAFTGDYDGYRAQIVGTNVKGAILFSAAAVARLDGITFSGFNPTTGVGAVVQVQTAASVINDCTFIANNAHYGAVYFLAAATVSNTRILYAWSTYRASAFTAGSGTPTITNCTFLCASRTSSDSGNVLNGWRGGFKVRNCTFARCLAASGTGFTAYYGGPGNIYAAESSSFTSFADCVLSNCYTACGNASGYATPFLSTGRGRLHIARTLFTNNVQRVKPIAGKCYAMVTAGLDSDKRLSFDSCTFSRNAIEAPQVSAATGDYVLSIIGNYPIRVDATLLNCSFDANTATAAPVEGVTPILCRGVATAAYAGGTPGQAGLANCAFRGPADGTYDIVQYGTGHAQSLNVVNCVFTADGEGRLDPVYADVPELVHLYSCSVQNLTGSTADLDSSALESDKVPLAAVASGGGPLFALAAAARTPGIRETCDVATNSLTWSDIASWNFRPAGASQWQALSPFTAALSGSGFDAKLVGDALGAARPAGAFTRGPVQTLAGDAENGATLVLRRDPFAAGSFSYEAVQAVPLGTAPAPVTVTLANPVAHRFAGWFDANGGLVSSNATLSLPALSESLTVITARIVSPKVPLTFCLDGHGTFAGSGTDTITIEEDALAAFPEVPPFTVAEGWHFVGFNLPAIVPETATTYTARLVSMALRVIHVVPAAEAPENGDGLTWATAYGDLGAAYEDAAAYRGEVWVKAGTYTLASSILMRSNVAVLGGFAGTETSADAADPEANPTILTGDVQDDNFWRPNSSGGNVASYKIWVNGVFQPPNPTGADAFWTPTGNYADDTPSAFSCASGIATNAAFDGIVFTLFREDTIQVITGLADGLSVTRCKFLGCTTGNADTADSGVIRLNNTGATIADCLFDGCCRGIFLNGSAPSVATIERCVFSNCFSASYGGTIFALNQGYAHVANCRFFRNCCKFRSYQGGAAVAFKGTSGTTWNTLSDCVFEENRPSADCHGTVVVSGGNAEIARCRFLRNSIANGNFVYENGNCASIGQYGGAFVARDCHFLGSSCADVSGNSLPFASVFGQAGGSAVFANCTMEGSAATNSSSTHAATIAQVGGSLALVNCLIDGSTFSGEHAEEVFSNAGSGSTLSIVNSVLRNGSAGYTPLAFTGSGFEPTIANSVIAGFDPSALPAVGSDGFLYDVVAGLATLGPLREGPNGALARGVAGPRYARFGRPVWLVGTTAYIHDPLSNASKPWRSLLSRANRWATVTGLDATSPLLPDAFGASRKASRVAIGPLNSPDMATVIQLK